MLVTVGGHTYRSSVASMGGRSLVSLSAENCTAGGDEVDVELVLDTEPRVLDVPPGAGRQAFVDDLSYSGRRAFTYWIDDAKKPPPWPRRWRCCARASAAERFPDDLPADSRRIVR